MAKQDALIRKLQAMLFGVNERDPLTYLTAAVIILLVQLLRGRSSAG